MASLLLLIAVLGACVENNESQSVTDVRNAKAEQLKSVAALNNAEASAKQILANAQAALLAAQAEAEKANAAKAQADAEYTKKQIELLELQKEAQTIANKQKQAQLEQELLALETAKKQAEATLAQIADNMKKQEQTAAKELAALQLDIAKAQQAIVDYEKGIATAATAAEKQQLLDLTSAYASAVQNLINAQSTLQNYQANLVSMQNYLTTAQEAKEELVADKTAEISLKQAKIESYKKYLNYTENHDELLTQKAALENDNLVKEQNYYTLLQDYELYEIDNTAMNEAGDAIYEDPFFIFINSGKVSIGKDDNGDNIYTTPELVVKHIDGEMISIPDYENAYLRWVYAYYNSETGLYDYEYDNPRLDEFGYEIPYAYSYQYYDYPLIAEFQGYKAVSTSVSHELKIDDSDYSIYLGENKTEIVGNWKYDDIRKVEIEITKTQKEEAEWLKSRKDELTNLQAAYSSNDGKVKLIPETDDDANFKYDAQEKLITKTILSVTDSASYYYKKYTETDETKEPLKKKEYLDRFNVNSDKERILEDKIESVTQEIAGLEANIKALATAWDYCENFDTHMAELQKKVDAYNEASTAAYVEKGKKYDEYRKAWVAYNEETAELDAINRLLEGYYSDHMGATSINDAIKTLEDEILVLQKDIDDVSTIESITEMIAYYEQQIAHQELIVKAKETALATAKAELEAVMPKAE
jgi:hypothetical protein